MVLTVTYSIDLDDEDVENIRKQLNRKPSLTPYVTMKDYLKDRLQGIVVVELQNDHDENVGIKCKQRYIEMHSY